MYIYSGLGQLPKSIGNIITYNDYKVMDPILHIVVCFLPLIVDHNPGYKSLPG